LGRGRPDAAARSRLLIILREASNGLFPPLRPYAMARGHRLII
jgi:hypothetical protein